MSQPSNSIISGDSAQTKYRKALKQISKLMATNRLLKENSQKLQRDLKQKNDELLLRCEDIQKQYQSMKQQKDNLSHYLTELQKQRNNLERQAGYLNDVVAEQNTELKKLNMHKDERAVAALIRTYEQKQKTMNQTRAQNQDIIAKLKITVERIQNDLQSQKNSKEELEDFNKKLSFQMTSYKEQNNSLLSQIQRLLKQSSQKDAYCAQKQKELRLLINELQKQITLLRNAQEESFKGYKSNDNQAYEQLLNEKNKQSLQLAKMQSAYQDMLLRQKQYYEMEQKMKSARLQAERANDEVNMLKSKIVVLEAKEFLEEAGDEETNQKYFQERLNILVHENDPLNYIRNHEDSSHFRILKSFIVDLQDKIYKISSEKKQTSRKYKSMKTKFVKNAQQLSHFQEQNKLMRGKLEGFERLTQKLQFQLERALAGNEQQITRMALTSNNLITRKAEQYKSTINLLNSQLEMNQDKASRTEKNYKQQIQTLRLELDTLKIRYKDETDKTNKDNELLELYKKKNNDLSNKVNNLEDQLTNLNENLNKFQQLFKQQKGKNQGLLAQKQQLLGQTRQMSQEIDKKSLTLSSSFKIKEDQYQFEIRKLKTENQKMKDQIEESSRQINNLNRDLEEIRRSDQSQVGEIKRLTQRNAELEGKLLDSKRTIRNLEDQIETNKIKYKKFQQNYEKNSKFEEQNFNKNDKINDLTRQKILLQNEIKSLQGQLNDEIKQNQQYKKQLSGLKMKNLESTHESKRQFQGKILEGKKTIQTLNQDISDLTTELRDEKSKCMRLTSQLNNIKAQKARLQDLIDQNRKKDLQNEGQVSNVKLELYNAQMQIQRLQGQIKNQQLIANNLNNEIEGLQQKIFSQNQELSSLKMKLESSQDLKNDLIRELNSIKFNFSTVETQANQAKTNFNMPWQEQNFYSSLSDILLKIRKICRNYGITIESSAGPATISFSQIEVSPGPQPIKPVTQPIQQKSPGGNSYFEFFKSYSDGNESGGNISGFKSVLGSASESNKNSGLNIGTTQSINKFEYNYSDTSYGFQPGVNVSTSSQDYYKPSYEYGQSNMNFDYNVSGVSKLAEI